MKKFNFFKAFAALSLFVASAFFVSCSNDDESHEHTFATAWSYDATHHWHAATCEHTDQVKDKAEHTFGEWTVAVAPTEATDGIKYKECSECHYSVVETIAKLDHTHTFATAYTSDATHHWHAATCGHTTDVKDKAEHTFGEWTSNNDASVTSDGTKTRICSDCLYEETVTDEGSKIEIVATPAFSVASGAVVSGTEVTITCTTEGTKIYYTTDGSAPTASSTEYTAAISVTEAVTIKAIAVKDGMNDSAVASASYLIIPTKDTCVPGDFVLKDGTMLPKDITLSDTQKSNVAAVIVRAAADDKPALGVGIVHNRSGLAWCKQYTDTENTIEVSGYSTNITALQGNEESGYMDGSNSWDLLVDACADLKNKTGEEFEKAAENYPAFNYCRLYGTKNNLSGDLANGWYLPTVAELYTIYQNKTAVDESLSNAGGSQFGTSVYWSCCQSPLFDDAARVLGFFSSCFVSNYSKDYDYYYNDVCSVRAFN